MLARKANEGRVVSMESTRHSTFAFTGSEARVGGAV